MHKAFSRSRRGVSAMEFALVLPVIVAMVMGLVDYGWLFSQQSQALSAVTAGLRAGSNVTPGLGAAPGTCDDCLVTSAGNVHYGLQNLGIDIQRDDLRPTIENIAGTCAMTLSVDIPHEPLLGLVPTPESYRVEAVWMLLNVDDC